MPVIAAPPATPSLSAAPASAGRSPLTAGMASGTAGAAPTIAPLMRRGRRPRLLHRLLAKLAAPLQCGRLRLELPDGTVMERCGPGEGPAAVLRLQRWRPLLRLLLRGDIGLAESYRDGDWSTPDLGALLLLGVCNRDSWRTTTDASLPARLADRLTHRRRDNSRAGSRRNIAFHYDLGNDFYRLWLDPRMIYSSALYRADTITLEQAQQAKLERVIELLALPAAGATCRVLEIGTGWGALACALGQRGHAVRGITLSREQLAHAQACVASAGLEDRVELALQDYRDTAGAFDRLVSIEMIEAVGQRHWPTYFAAVHDRLRPGGLAVIQAITIGDGDFEHYRRNSDFIQQFIFPGGMLPSTRLFRQHANAAGLAVESEQTFGQSYAATLAEWRRRFLAAWPAIERLGFDEPFRRLWEYYLCYCEAGFRGGQVDVGLYVLRRR